MYYPTQTKEEALVNSFVDGVFLGGIGVYLGDIFGNIFIFNRRNLYDIIIPSSRISVFIGGFLAGGIAGFTGYYIDRFANNFLRIVFIGMIILFFDELLDIETQNGREITEGVVIDTVVTTIIIILIGQNALESYVKNYQVRKGIIPNVKDNVRFEVDFLSTFIITIYLLIRRRSV